MFLETPLSSFGRVESLAAEESMAVYPSDIYLSIDVYRAVLAVESASEKTASSAWPPPPFPAPQRKERDCIFGLLTAFFFFPGSISSQTIYGSSIEMANLSAAGREGGRGGGHESG